MAEPNPADGTRESPPRPTHDPLRSTSVNAGAANPSLPADPVPERIGQFEIKMLLGEGACGRVYLGFDPELERQVAIKQPHRARLTAEFRERFLREAKATATIHHANVCPVYIVGTDGDLPYIVMHYVAGGTLAGLLDSDGTPLQLRQKLTIAWKLAKGLAAAHAQKVTHRDLKPANVLYDKARREVLITDFGLARIGTQARGTMEGAVFGTPAYMSPEQARGKVGAIGPLSDVYSLGVILYEMLAGRVPFTGTVWDVMRQHCEAMPHPPSVVRPGLDPRLDVICAKAMAKEPAHRYQSAKEFADAVADFLRGGEPVELVEAPPTPPVYDLDPEPPAPTASGRQGAGKGPPPLPTKQRPLAPRPTDEPLVDHAQRKWRGVQMVGLLMLLFALALGTVVALKPTAKLPEPEPPPTPPVQNPNKFDQAAERKAAEQLLELKVDLERQKNPGTVRIFVNQAGKNREIKTPAELGGEGEFTIAEIDVRNVSRDIDAKFRACLAGLSGPLDLRFEHVSFLGDDAMNLIARIPKLADLHLEDTPRVTDTGLSALSKHPELRSLRLANLNVTSNAVGTTAHSLPKLRRLYLDRALVSDELLHALKGSPVTELDLNWQSIPRSSRLSKTGIEAIATLKDLTELTLSAHPVEDGWLPPLYPLKLKSIDLRFTNITTPGRDALQKAMGPDCKVKPESPSDP